jgi:uncharacterized protein YcfL
MKTIPFSILRAGLLAVAASTFLSACSSVNTVERQTPEGQKQMVADKRVITDESLNKAVSIVGVNTAIVSTGFLKIQVELLNKTSDTQNFSYKIEWFDGNGMIVNTPTSVWVARQILPAQTLSITAVAPTESAKDFRIQLFRK